MVPADVPTSSAAAWPLSADLRGWLRLLEQYGQLRRLKQPVDPDQEVGAVLHACDNRSAVLFQDVLGSQYPLLGNTVGLRSNFARALGCSESDVVHKIASALATPRHLQEVDQGHAPVAQVHIDSENLLDDLPLPVQHELDAGRYLTSALVAVQDPRTGRTNLSINRLQATGPLELRALMLPGRLRSVFAAHEDRGEDLPVALCIGVDPLLTLASQAPAEADLDDLEFASAMHPAPLEVVRLPGHPTPLPARAEMILLGRVRAGRREQEGPFGEYPRTYGPGGPAPVIELTSRWQRRDPIVQTILSGGREHFWVGGLPREARLARTLTAAGLQPAAVRLTEAGSCRMHAVVSLRNAGAGAANHAAMAVFSGLAPVKLVVVVDDDVDIFDDEQVGWAVATRFQADRDMLVVPRTRGGGLDPSAGSGPTAKIALDATIGSRDSAQHTQMRAAVPDPHRLSTLLDSLEPSLD